jgi:hypothetical protein
VAPDGSLTKPEILPRSDCANRIPDATRLTKSSKTVLRLAFRAFCILASVFQSLQSNFSF